ncbi:MAG: hypothetical protein HUU50_01165 [Candidatus Brocadiae bacterium]|nr:hypothetical protein [Candidatus Brocadiia bacterium]
MTKGKSQFAKYFDAFGIIFLEKSRIYMQRPLSSLRLCGKFFLKWGSYLIIGVTQVFLTY